MAIKALLPAAAVLLLLQLAVSADAQQCADNCQPCARDADCCKNGVCGCLNNPIQGGPPRVCRCQGFNLNECVAVNVQRAKAAKAAAAAASGQTVEVKPPAKCVKVPKNAVRKVPCEEDGSKIATADPAPSVTPAANTTVASSNTSGVTAQAPLK